MLSFSRALLFLIWQHPIKCRAALLTCISDGLSPLGVGIIGDQQSGFLPRKHQESNCT